MKDADNVFKNGGKGSFVCTSGSMIENNVHPAFPLHAFLVKIPVGNVRNPPVWCIVLAIGVSVKGRILSCLIGLGRQKGNMLHGD